jgi:ABC-2 type transport system ATP-binding protein
MLVGLSAPTKGTANVLGRPPTQTTEFLASIGYLAQDVPLYRRLSAGDHLAMGERLNARFDAAAARTRLASLNIPLEHPVGTLSGGQRAQVGLGLALAKRPQVLLLDEPVAALDPLARRAFLASLSDAVADGDLTVIMSSHLLHDLERVCDHLILLAASRTQLCTDIDNVLGIHKMLLGPRRKTVGLDSSFEVIRATHTANQTRLLVRHEGPVHDPTWEVSEP